MRNDPQSCDSMRFNQATLCAYQFVAASSTQWFEAATPPDFRLSQSNAASPSAT